MNPGLQKAQPHNRYSIQNFINANPETVKIHLNRSYNI